MNKDCPFCTSVKKEGRMLTEGKHAFVVLSNPRIQPGHLLVIPKRHTEGKLADLTPEESNEVFDLLSEFQAKILAKLSSGCDIRQNFKPYVKDSATHVNHMHWHLHPREYNDEFQQKVGIHSQALYRSLPDEEQERLATLLGD